MEAHLLSLILDSRHWSLSLLFTSIIILCLSTLRIKGGSPVVPDPRLEALKPLPPVLVYHHLVVFVHA
jgi:hypothetical protein